MVDTKNEIWKEIRLNTNYLVSNLGRVKSKARLVKIATPEQIAYIKHQFNLENRTLGGRKNKDFYERMAIKFGYSDPQSIYRILLGRTNKYFGEDIVQTTKHDALL